MSQNTNPERIGLAYSDRHSKLNRLRSRHRCIWGTLVSGMDFFGSFLGSFDNSL
jgi:hypothetical protein